MSERPNLLLITTDQQRWDAGGGAGPGFLRTPHFDHLCREGVRFERAYSDCPMCVPARMTLLTGKHAINHGLTANGPSRPYAAPDETLPGILGAAGYQTMAIGKMHFHPQRYRHGFQEMILPDDYYREMERGGKKPMRHGLGQNELFPSRSTVPETDTLTSWIADQCADFIRHRRDPEVPFFLWASFSKPHPPLDPPEPYYSMYRDEAIPEAVVSDWCDAECPEAIRRFRERFGYEKLTPEVIRAARAAYYGLITQIDYNMGRIFAALRDAGLWKNTVICYTSDHGEYLGDHRMGAKGFFHDPSARVPFVLRLPPREPWTSCDRVSSDLVCLADVFPTFLSAANVPASQEVDGVDLCPVAKGESSIGPRRIVSVFADEKNCLQLATTDGKWKYLWFPEGPAEQLFDLENDPGECHNLASEEMYREIRDDFYQSLTEQLKKANSPHAVGGELVRTPIVVDPPGFRGAHGLPGYLMEDVDKDTRH